MKLSKILILSLGMALCAGGAVGAAVAFDQTSASIADQTAVVDKAAQLYWGAGESSADILPVTNLDSTPQFRFLEVSPKTTKTLAGTVTLSFSVAAYGEHGVCTGVTAEVWEITSVEKNAETIAATIAAKDVSYRKATISGAGSDSFGISVSANTSSVTNYYAIKMAYDGSYPGDGNSVSARMTVHQAFAAA